MRRNVPRTARGRLLIITPRQILKSGRQQARTRVMAKLTPIEQGPGNDDNKVVYADDY